MPARVASPVMYEIFPIGIVIGYIMALTVLYWVVRLAVRHAIRDADDRRLGPRL